MLGNIYYVPWEKKSKSNRVGEIEAGVSDGRDSREIKLVVFWDLPGVPVVKTLCG